MRNAYATPSLVRIAVIAIVLFALAIVAEASDNSTVNFGANSNISAFSTCKKVTNNSGTGLSVYVPTQSVGEWASFYNNPPAGITIGSCATNITVPSGTNLNLYTIAGSPSTPGTYVFTIPAGTVINSSVTWLPALTTGSWPAGSTVTVINNGSIYGRGGDGGRGTNVNSCTGAGGNGGPALGMSYPLTIDNTNGSVFGGGGGGGGGGSGISRGIPNISGGGGGGGQGSVDSSGGAGGVGTYSASAGSAGTASGPGRGGLGARGTAIYRGGDGGGWGSSGSSGAPGSGGGTIKCTGRPGGAGGAAITGAGYGITWLGGNNGTHLKGAVQ